MTAHDGAGATGTAACSARHGPAWVVDGTVPGEPTADATTDSGDLAVLGCRLGAARWVEHRLFEVVGRWASDDPCPAATILFAVLARRFAWHASLLADQLPVLAITDPDVLTTAPPGWEALGDALDAPAHGPQATAHRLVGLGRVVLPRLVVGYARWLAWAGPEAAPLRQAGRLVLADERDAWVAVEAMAQDHTAGAVDSAGHRQAALESLLDAPESGRPPPRMP